MQKQKHQRPLLLFTWLLLVFTKAFGEHVPDCILSGCPSDVGVGGGGGGWRGNHHGFEVLILDAVTCMPQDGGGSASKYVCYVCARVYHKVGISLPPCS